MTLRSHLHTEHTHAAEQASRRVARHEKMAEVLDKIGVHIGAFQLSKNDAGNSTAATELAECIKSLAAEHRQWASDEVGLARHHAQCAEDLADARKFSGDDDDLRKGMVPSAVMGINPLPGGIRPVPRSGQPSETFGKVASGCEEFTRLD